MIYSIKENGLINFTKDPLFNKLFSSYGYFGTQLLFSIPHFLFCIISYYEESFFLNQKFIDQNIQQIPFSTDIGAWAFYINIILSSFLIKSLFKEAPYSFQRIWDRNLFSGTSYDKYKNYFKHYEDQANSNVIYIFGAFFGLLYCIYNFFIDPILPGDPRLPNQIWFAHPGYFQLGGYSMTLVMGYLIFILSIVTWKIYVLINCMRGLTNRDDIRLNLQPLNPDMSAGLQPLGNLSFKISNVILAVGLFIIQQFFIRIIYPDYGSFTISYSLLLLPTYIILATFLFFYPLLSAHNIMKKQKNELLDNLSAEIGITCHEFSLSLLNHDREINTEKVDKILKIRDLYLVAGKMPVWPFDTETIIKFFGTVMLPVIMVGAESLFSAIL